MIDVVFIDSYGEISAVFVLFWQEKTRFVHFLQAEILILEKEEYTGCRKHFAKTATISGGPVDFSAFVSQKQKEIERLKNFDIREVTPSIRDFEYYVQTFRDDLSLIGEIRKVNHEGETFSLQTSAKEIASLFESAGCDALCVMTEETFAMKIDELYHASKTVSFPVLQKELILCREQIYQARAFGADAIWLQTTCLSQSDLIELQGVARTLHMDSVLGVSSEEDLQKTLGAQSKMIAICTNTPFLGGGKIEEDLALAEKVPEEKIILVTSKLEKPDDLLLLEGKVDSVFLGANILQAKDISSCVAEFCNTL